MIARSLTFLSIFLLFACNQKQKEITGPRELHYEMDTISFGSEKKGVLFLIEDIRILDTVVPAPTVQKQIEEHLVASNVNFNQEFRSYEALYESMLNERKSFAADGFESPVPWELQQGLKVYLNENGLFGLQSKHMSYTGGAHPNYFISSLLFRLKDGAEMRLDSILLPGEKDRLSTLAEVSLKQQYQVGENEELSAKGFWFEKDEFFLSPTFLYGPEGFTIIYNPYDIAPYSMGSIEIFIPYSQVHEIIRPEYRFESESQLNS